MKRKNNEKRKKNKKRNKNVLAEYLANYHVGMDNCITSKEISKTLRKQYRAKRNQIVWDVHQLRRDGIPICSCRYGYYYPDACSDIMDTVTRFGKYMSTLTTTSEAMVGSITNF